MRLRFILLIFSVLISTSCFAQDKTHPPKRTLNSYFPFAVPESVEAWETRKELLRDHLKTSLGLNPMPEKTPLNTVVFGSIDKGDYVIKKVYFESMPGFLVTGNLYKPKNITEKAPTVLCPHGHHRDGRFRSASEKEIDDQIAKGAEKFRNNARSPLQARCAHLAKMGCIVFHYDMIGYADSQQISYGVAHGFAKQREHMNENDHYGFFSPIAESRSQSIMGLQTWNSIRALDFLETLKEVDTDRIGVTGASGGGTQTFMLCALDDRPSVSFPAVMVSTAMQGGCTCENCCNLRVGTGNVEFAAMFAPKPMGITAADDWTKEMESKGFPELKRLYSLLGAPENVELTARLEFEHNYNQVCREAMYRFFDKHLGLNGNTTETEIEFVPPEELKVINDTNRPKLNGEELEAHLLNHWQSSRQSSLEKMKLDSFELSVFYRDRIGDLMGERLNPLAVEITDARELEDGTTEITFTDSDGFKFDIRLTVGNAGGRTVFIVGNNEQLQKKISVQGFNTVTLSFEHDSEINQLVQNGREAAAYTFGYNRSQLSRRAAQLISLARQTSQLDGLKPILVGTENGIEIAVLAATQLVEDLDAFAVDDWDKFKFSAESLSDEKFLPGSMTFAAAAYLTSIGDLPALIGGQPTEEIRPLEGKQPALAARPEFVDTDKFEERLMEWCSEVKRK